MSTPQKKQIKQKIDVVPDLQNRILTIRGERVILDSDLAEIYGIETKRLNEQVRRNAERFPSDFAFVLTPQEAGNLKSQIATSSSHGGRRKIPRVFTEHGALMAANVLNSKRAVGLRVYASRVCFFSCACRLQADGSEAGIFLKNFGE